MLRVGITGGIGTGKSTVCNIFKCLRIPTFDADREAKKLYDTNKQVKEKVLERFGNSLYQQGVFQPKQLAAIVFQDTNALRDLNDIIHPVVIQESDRWFDAQTSPYAVKEAALLIESGGHTHLDKIILVQAPLEERVQRIILRDNTDAAAVKKRIDKQMPEAEKVAFADFIIHNGQDDFLIEQVKAIHQKILSLCE